MRRADEELRRSVLQIPPESRLQLHAVPSTLAEGTEPAGRDRRYAAILRVGRDMLAGLLPVRPFAVLLGGTERLQSQSRTMAWTTPQSPPQDVALDGAWDSLNQVLDGRVRVSLQLRLTSCVSDILSFVTLLRELEAAEIHRSEVLDEQLAEWQTSDHRRPPRHHWESHFSFQFAAALKAVFYFVRALQDATYAALLEAGGNRPGAYSSMQGCAKNVANPLRPLIDNALPEYFAWFADLRTLRNEMKLGASTSFEFRGAAGAREMYVVLQVVNDARRHVSSGRKLSLADVEKSLSHSAHLLEWAAACVSQWPKPRLQQTSP
jgi:hypothetical protein